MLASDNKSGIPREHAVVTGTPDHVDGVDLHVAQVGDGIHRGPRDTSKWSFRVESSERVARLPRA